MTQLREKLDHIRKYGWFKNRRRPGSYRNGAFVVPHKGTDPDSKHGVSCAMSVFGFAMDTDDARALHAVVTEQWPDRCARGDDVYRSKMVDVVMWNNHWDTTFADIELAFEKAAVKREEEV